MATTFLVFRVALALVLLASGASKAAKPRDLADIIRSRPGVSFFGDTRFIRLLGTAEVIVGILLLTPQFWQVAAFGATALLATFAAVLMYWFRIGASGECGCGGIVPHSQLSRTHAAVLIGAALLSALSTTQTSSDGGLAIAVAIAVLCAAAATAALVTRTHLFLSKRYGS